MRTRIAASMNSASLRPSVKTTIGSPSADDACVSSKAARLGSVGSGIQSPSTRSETSNRTRVVDGTAAKAARDHVQPVRFFPHVEQFRELFAGQTAVARSVHDLRCECVAPVIEQRVPPRVVGQLHSPTRSLGATRGRRCVHESPRRRTGSPETASRRGRQAARR